MAVVSTGAAINSSGNLSSIRPIKYRAGQGVSVRFTALFTSGVVGNTQMAGAFDSSDGIGFGFNGINFGLFHKKNSVINWIEQTSWNTDKLDGSGPSGLNIFFEDGKGNVFEVQFQYLGFGGLIFSVENPNTTKYVTVHIIAYSNTEVTPSFHVPSFPLAIESNNTTNNTDIIVKSSSMMGGIEGPIVYSGPQFNDSWLNSNVTNGVETFIGAWNIRTTFQGQDNKTLSHPTQYSLASGPTDKPQILRFRKNGTFTSPVWTDISTTQSVMQRLTSGTWDDDSGLVVSLIMVPGKGDPYFRSLEITARSLYGSPGDNLVITLQGVGGSGSSSGSISWLEDQ